MYKVATYSFDNTGCHSMNWTATTPTTALGLIGYWDGTGLNNTFTAPSDEQTITWTGGGATQAPAIFTLAADSSGKISVYGWGGNGVTGNSSSDTSYLNGFQIAVPEVNAFALGVAVCGMVGLTYIARRNRKTVVAAA
jgi:hypothetical protein